MVWKILNQFMQYVSINAFYKKEFLDLLST